MKDFFCFTLSALFELIRFDVAIKVFGSASVLKKAATLRTLPAACPDKTEQCIVSAVDSAVCLYMKWVPCLQRSVVTARLLRWNGIDAHIVIGVRSEPFFGHAWVEVDGRIVNDSLGYQRALTVLTRI